MTPEEIEAKRLEDEKKLEEQPVEEDEFGDAFNEAVALDNGGSEDEPTEDNGEPEVEAKDEPNAEEGEAEEEDEPAAKDAEDEPAPDVEPKKGEEGETLEEIQHKYSTVSGMYTSSEKKNKDLQAEIDRLKAGATPSPKEDDSEEEEKKAPKADAKSLTDALMSSESFKDLEEELGDTLPKALGDMTSNILTYVTDTVEKVMAAKLEPLSQQIKPLVTKDAKSVEEAHWEKLDAVHSDSQKFIDNGELQEWIDGRAGMKKKMYQDVYNGTNGSTTDDVIDLFSAFKDDKGYSEPGPEKKKPATPKPKVDTKKLEAMEEVETKKGGITGTKAGAAKDDYDAAWNEAP
ncbi:hypothetical protein KAR91_17320 [Candidatus Pacearchaeota archaeon]|nr:hypothetical protein [Candidatus Pacearchaeota archaeon]